MAQLKAHGESIETVKAEIVAGDAADLNVVDMKGKRSIVISTRVNETFNFLMDY